MGQDRRSLDMGAAAHLRDGIGDQRPTTLAREFRQHPAAVGIRGEWAADDPAALVRGDEFDQGLDLRRGQRGFAHRHLQAGGLDVAALGSLPSARVATGGSLPGIQGLSQGPVQMHGPRHATPGIGHGSTRQPTHITQGSRAGFG